VIRRDAPAQRGLTDINIRKAPIGRFFIAGYEVSSAFARQSAWR